MNANLPAENCAGNPSVLVRGKKILSDAKSAAFDTLVKDSGLPALNGWCVETYCLPESAGVADETGWKNNLCEILSRGSWNRTADGCRIHIVYGNRAFYVSGNTLECSDGAVYKRT